MNAMDCSHETEANVQVLLIVRVILMQWPCSCKSTGEYGTQSFVLLLGHVSLWLRCPQSAPHLHFKDTQVFKHLACKTPGLRLPGTLRLKLLIQFLSKDLSNVEICLQSVPLHVSVGDLPKLPAYHPFFEVEAFWFLVP